MPRLTWETCADGFECATARVPLDHHDPHGAGIDLAVIRHPATDRAHRIGSLFYNPGGPAVPGTVALPAMLGRFPEEVRKRFDIVSFDPRGTGASAPVQCFDDPADEQALLAGTAAGYPEGEEQQQAWAAAYQQVARQCAARNPALLPHVSTANVARDMDLLRRAVGDRQLSYLGTSYGSYLGATYANLFPGRVRAMILDSAPDPVAWSTGRGGQAATTGTLLRNGSDVAAGRVLDAFLDRCGQAGTRDDPQNGSQADPQACAFSAGTAAATRARYGELLTRLRTRPVALGGMTFTAGTALETTILSLYAANPVPGIPGTGWTQLGATLQALWAATEAPDAPTASLPPVVHQSPDQALAVACSDGANPPARADYPALAAFARARSGEVGPYFAWADERCADWPARDRDRYDGPWNHPTAQPILVVADTGDPAMPYEGSRAMARSLARARLLTVDGYGHTVLANPSDCAARHETRYLVDGVLPAPGTVCAPDQRPFNG
ncbi:alpha/beta hydrolase [Kitasatospora sp. NPDC097691]|uniref:alpha/beta hydrolase n=1 Tax=Kitasatospora sp. NPDC097691 TaxID=3157231 RepID=UPI0033312A92